MNNLITNYVVKEKVVTLILSSILGIRDPGGLYLELYNTVARGITPGLQDILFDRINSYAHRPLTSTVSDLYNSISCINLMVSIHDIEDYTFHELTGIRLIYDSLVTSRELKDIMFRVDGGVALNSRISKGNICRRVAAHTLPNYATNKDDVDWLLTKLNSEIITKADLIAYDMLMFLNMATAVLVISRYHPSKNLYLWGEDKVVDKTQILE